MRRLLLGIVVLATALLGAPVDASSVRVSASGCGSLPRLSAGPVVLTVGNDATAFAAIYLIDPANRVYAEIPSLTPGKTLPLTTTLGAGTYALRCVFTDGKVRTSAPITVTGQTRG